ncbi:F0F1 ATP synthase subunit delta [Micrococcales bacterium 31B]|nr:F0F1 ATP synthase subunit delta [Micrococcales bacterium 31B]
MNGASRAAFQSVADTFESDLKKAGATALALGEELFQVVALLDSNGSLRRSLTDPGRDGNDKAALAKSIFTGKLDDRVVKALAELASQRWSDDGDIIEACERLGVAAVFASTEASGDFDRVESELFRFERTIAGSHELSGALSNPVLTSAEASALVQGLLKGKAAPATVVLAQQAAASQRGVKVTARLQRFAETAANRRARLIATVTSAVKLSQAQETRLAAALRKLYGRDVQINALVDAEIIGGMQVRVGEELIDATTASRLAQARRHVAG